MLADVDEIVKHPLYRREDAGSPDLAVLRLAKPLPDRFIPAELSPRGFAEGGALIAAGYGKTSAKESAAKPALRMVLLRVTQTFRGWMILSSISEDPSGGGAGDSGGPVFTYRGMHTLVGSHHRRLGEADQGAGAGDALQLDQRDAGEAAGQDERAIAPTSPPPPPPPRGVNS